MAKKSNANNEDDIQLTLDEAKSLEQAFQDESFRKLLAEYASEIADSKYRDEQEAYIKQLEQQNELPEGKTLIRPKEGFVVKCQKKKGGESERKNKNKLFLNIVHSDEVTKPSCEAHASGKNWSVPYVLGPLHMETDKAGDMVPTFDCCFNPLSLRYAHGSKSFCDLIVGIAKDAIEKSFQVSGDEIELKDGYTILKGITYKSGSAPKTMMVETHKVKGQDESNSNKTMLQTKAPKTEDIGRNGKATRSRSNSVIVPDYKVVERGNFEIADHTMTLMPAPRRPKDLVVHVSLYHITAVSDIVLDVSERNLVVKSATESTPKYLLDIKLHYPVSSTNGSAKFDKKQSKLTVVLPVIGE